MNVDFINKRDGVLHQSKGMQSLEVNGGSQSLQDLTKLDQRRVSKQFTVKAEVYSSSLRDSPLDQFDQIRIHKWDNQTVYGMDANNNRLWFNSPFGFPNDIKSSISEFDASEEDFDLNYDHWNYSTQSVKYSSYTRSYSNDTVSLKTVDVIDSLDNVIAEAEDTVSLTSSSLWSQSMISLVSDDSTGTVIENEHINGIPREFDEVFSLNEDLEQTNEELTSQMNYDKIDNENEITLLPQVQYEMIAECSNENGILNEENIQTEVASQIIGEVYQNITTTTQDVIENDSKSEQNTKIDSVGTRNVQQPSLPLTRDNSDICKTSSTWESINLLANSVLTIWVDKEKQNIPKVGINKLLNPVLPCPVKYLCLRPELDDQLILRPDVCLPFRKCQSEIDLSQLVPNESICANESDSIKKLTSKLNNNFSGFSLKGDQSTIRSIVRFQLDNELIENDIKTNDKSNLDLSENIKTEFKLLANIQDLGNPNNFAHFVSKIERKYYLNLAWKEFMPLVFKNVSGSCINLRKMFEFGQELSKLISTLINAELTSDHQAKVITSAIEVAYILHQKQNFQSFVSVMRGLQLPEVYRLTSAWKMVKQTNPNSLKKFISMSSMLCHNKTVIYPVGMSVPTISSFVQNLRIRCLSLWDSLENKARWTQGSFIIEWLKQFQFDEDEIQRKLDQKAGLIMEGKDKQCNKKKKKRRKVSFRGLVKSKTSKKHSDTLSTRKASKKDKTKVLTLKQQTKIQCFNENELPPTWKVRSSRHLPCQYKMIVMSHFPEIFNEIMANIKSYKFIN